jgi:hypothetical protein
MSKNVMIPLSLLERVAGFLEVLDLLESHSLYYDYCDVLCALKLKMRKLELHDTYSKIVSAKNDDDRHEARIEYLRQKRDLRYADTPQISFY